MAFTSVCPCSYSRTGLVSRGDSTCWQHPAASPPQTQHARGVGNITIHTSKLGTSQNTIFLLFIYLFTYLFLSAGCRIAATDFLHLWLESHGICTRSGKIPDPRLLHLPGHKPLGIYQRCAPAPWGSPRRDTAEPHLAGGSLTQATRELGWPVEPSNLLLPSWEKSPWGAAQGTTGTGHSSCLVCSPRSTLYSPLLPKT